MIYKSIRIPLIGALATLVTTGTPVVIGFYASVAHAQTQGMERREDRRGTRQGAREEKHECNASGDSSRAGCRQEKRDTKQTGREYRAGTNPAPNGVTAPTP
jgi:hypothetical protein